MIEMINIEKKFQEKVLFQNTIIVVTHDGYVKGRGERVIEL